MRLSAPNQTVFIIAAILAILAVVSTFVVIQFVTANAFWILTAAFVVLALGNLMKGM